MDALHSFVCALNCDSRNKAAWLNLGVLYERSEQWEDALICYKCALMAITGFDDLALNSAPSPHPAPIDVDAILAQYNQKLGKYNLIIEKLIKIENEKKTFFF